MSVVAIAKKAGSLADAGCEARQLILPALDLRPQVVLRVTLSNVLYKRAVVRHEVGGDVNSLCVPDLAILQVVLLWVERRQEAQLCTDAEVRDDDVQGLVEELVLADLLHEVVANSLLCCDGALNASFEQRLVLLHIGALHHRLGRDGARELIEAQRLEVHDVADVEAEDPVVCSEILHS